MARWISILAHPFVMVALLVVVAAQRASPGAPAIHAAFLVIVVTLGPVAILMWRQVRRGRWSNVDASNAAERPVLFAVALAALSALLLWLVINDPESFLIRGTLGVTLLVAAAAVLTRWIKLSLHLAFAGMTAAALILIGSGTGLIVLAALPFLAWSRLALSRHRPAELILGFVLGVIAGVGIVGL